MLSMFSPKYPSTNAITISIGSQSEDEDFKVYDLPNKKVLLLSSSYVDTQRVTILKTFHIANMEKILEEKKFKQILKLTCIFPDGSILLQNQPYNPSILVKLSSKLEFISTLKWDGRYLHDSAVAINNESFIVIREKLEGCVICIYKWDQKSCKEMKFVDIFPYLKPTSSPENIKSLGNNRYCCKLSGRVGDSKEHQRFILIFEINPNTYQVSGCGVIKIDSLYDLVVLPNMQLLTYQVFDKRVQIWDTNKIITSAESANEVKYVCVKEWNWDNIDKSGDFRSESPDILPFPDSSHLLLQSQYKNLFLFNMDTLEIKKINTSFKHIKSSHFNMASILPNGHVIVCAPKGRNSIAITFELNEIIPYTKSKEIVTQSQHLFRLFLNDIKFPLELTNYIGLFSHALTSDAVKMRTKMIEDESMKNEDKRTLSSWSWF